MKTFNTYFDSPTQFTDFVQQTEIVNLREQSASILVQVFSGIVDETSINEVRSLISQLMPNAIVIGATTAGEILNGAVSSRRIAVSISFFEKTNLQKFSFQFTGPNIDELAQLRYFTFQDDDSAAEKLALEIKESILTPNTKGILLFVSYSASEAYLLLKKLDIYLPGIPVFGGIAGDNLQYEKRFVFNNDINTQAGLVAVSLNSDSLSLSTEYHLNWQTIGKIFTVTDCEANLIKTIDHIPAAEIYNKYLGEFTPGGALEFPLIFNKGGVQVARVPSGFVGSDYISIGSIVEIGDQFQFSYGHLESILSKTDEMIESISQNPVECIFVYSCAARRSFMQESAEQETLPLNAVATNVGFFTYGEFFHGNTKNQLLNETMTLLMLSETDKIVHREIENKQSKEDGDYVHQKLQSILKVMNRLITQVTSELNESNNRLNSANEELSTLLEQVRSSSTIIENKNKSITDSIQYAKRIQTAILPSIEQLGSCMPENFILFKPKDIVSGDFFWIRDMRCNQSQQNNTEINCDAISSTRKIIFAAADCTGHGVPGAFMSMLGIALLNEIVNRYAESQTVNDMRPSDILVELRNKIKVSLRQTGREGETKDGMDISLCIIDSSTNTLEYAGANNPLWIIRRNENSKAELIEYKADKMPIGIYRHEQEEFTNHSVQLKHGDSVYLSSDGFEDQFGGEKGRKFLAKNLKQLLVDINEQSMLQQKETLEETLTSWMDDNHEQVDDILVMGLRINC